MKKVIPESATLVPDNARLSYKGQIFEFYVWPQEMFDGSIREFEMLKRPDTVHIIGVKNGKIVMIKDEQPGRPVRTCFPGGRVDDSDESWLASAQREMREETGLTFRNWRLLAVEQPQSKIEWFVPWFLATDVIDELPQELDEEGEKITVEEWEYDKLRKYILDGIEPTLNYALPFMIRIASIEELLALPEYVGRQVDR